MRKLALMSAAFALIGVMIFRYSASAPAQQMIDSPLVGTWKNDVLDT